MVAREMSQKQELLSFSATFSASVSESGCTDHHGSLLLGRGVCAVFSYVGCLAHCYQCTEHTKKSTNISHMTRGLAKVRLKGSKGYLQSPPPLASTKWI